MSQSSTPGAVYGGQRPQMPGGQVGGPGGYRPQPPQAAPFQPTPYSPSQGWQDFAQRNTAARRQAWGAPPPYQPPQQPAWGRPAILDQMAQYRASQQNRFGNLPPPNTSAYGPPGGQQPGSPPPTANGVPIGPQAPYGPNNPAGYRGAPPPQASMQATNQSMEWRPQMMPPGGGFMGGYRPPPQPQPGGQGGFQPEGGGRAMLPPGFVPQPYQGGAAPAPVRPPVQGGQGFDQVTSMMDQQMPVLYAQALRGGV